jgi:subtilase family serine protease
MKSVNRLLFSRNILSVISLAVLSLLLVAAAAAQTLHLSQTPAAVLDGRAVLQGHYEPSQMLRLAIALAPPHPVEEQQFLEDVQNKQSPRFHQFLSADEWNTRFGPTEEDEQAVADWAASQGLKVTHRYANRLIVDVEAQAGVIENAFHVTINRYQMTDDNGPEQYTVFSNDRDPQLPLRLTEVVASVQGLNSVERMMPMSAGGRFMATPDYVPGPVERKSEAWRGDAIAHESAGAREDEAAANLGALTPQVTQPTAGYFTPQNLWASTAYDYQALMNLGHCCNPLHNPVNSPRETTIVVAAFGDVAPSDVETFANQFSLTYNFQKIYIDGTYVCNNNTPNGIDPNCNETTMDTEWSLATANSQTTADTTAEILIYEGSNGNPNSFTDVYNLILNEGLARTLSTSFGCPENQNQCTPATMQTLDNTFSQMVGQGWTLVAASGDQGPTATCTPLFTISFPSSDPNFVAVGGTQLNETTGSQYEVDWTGSNVGGSCSGNLGGSSGGFSSTFPVPPYQKYLGFAQRATPDVALDAITSHDLYLNGAWTGARGTSVAAPMFAGFFAQENAYLLSLGNKCGASGTAPCAPLGNANYPIYAEARFQGAAHYPFYDIVSGCSTNDITTFYQLKAYCATPGYDLVTGWGSANMLQLAWAINRDLTPATGLPYITFTGPAPNKWYNTNQIVQWSVNDFPGTGISPSSATGIAGFSQAWDGLVTDSVTEPHGGTNDLFYSGPQFPNATGGCLSLAPGVGCSGGVPTGQGCHTVQVHGWNNQGGTTAGQPNFPETYGPLCYDAVPPLVSIVNNLTPTPADWFNGPVLVNIIALDPGQNASGVQQIYFGINDKCRTSNLKTCGTYGQAFTLSGEGLYNVVAYSQDVAGNFSTQATDVVRIDQTPPVTVAPSETVYFRLARIVLTASDKLSGVLRTFYQLDGGPVLTYNTPILLTRPGKHTLFYWSEDNAYNNEEGHTLTFTIRH